MTAPLSQRVRRRVVGELAGAPVEPSDVRRLALDEDPLLGGAELEQLVQGVLAATTGLGSLDPVLADPEVSEVMVNGPGPVWVERGGQIEQTAVVMARAELDAVIERIVSPLGLRVDRSSPMVDARLPDGSRVNAVVPPLAVDGPYLTIRRFGARRRSLIDFATPEVVEVLQRAVSERRNIVVSGGTGAGKTSLLNSLAASIPPTDRIVTVEDAAELRLQQPHVVRLEARPANAEGAGEARVRDLVRNALRMRPDRIVVGECRGGEALDMLQAMNTGHEGSLSTCHANSAADARHRLETMVLLGDVALPLDAIRAQVDASVDLLVHVARDAAGRRSIVELAEPDGAGGVRPVGSGDGDRLQLLRPPRLW